MWLFIIFASDWVRWTLGDACGDDAVSHHVASHHAIEVGVRGKRHGLLQAAGLSRTGDVAPCHAFGGVSGLPDNVAAVQARLSSTRQCCA